MLYLVYIEAMKKLLKKLSSTSRENLHKDSAFKSLDNLNSFESIGYEVKEKELSKLCRAIWNGDLPSVEKLVMKDQMLPDKESRLVNLISHFQNSTSFSLC